MTYGEPMTSTDLIAAIDQEIARLTQARALLAGTRNGTTFTGRPTRRRLSAAARKRISDAQKKRWAAQKKAQK